MFCAVQPNRMEQEMSIILTNMGGSVSVTNNETSTDDGLPHNCGC